MAEERIEAGGNTEQWRAFAQGSDPVEPKKRSLAPIIIGVVVAALIIGLLALLIFM
jgi:hypothetical protein